MGTTCKQSDFEIIGEGSVFLLTPISTDAEAWVDAHIPTDALRLNNSVAVEHRFIRDIVSGIRGDGLEVRRVA